MKNKLLKSCFLSLAGLLALQSNNLNAQVPADYTIATWAHFKPAAVSYTFDDNTKNQLPIALPLFDQYKYKVTFFTVTGWTVDWLKLSAASTNGHEVASHTVSHESLNGISIPLQDSELSQSQKTINSNLKNDECVTIAYPNCNIGDIPTVQKYYIAGRTCSGNIVASTPADFYNISSMLTGSESTVKVAADFNTKANAAKTAKGWAIFLLHGIDNDGGYSSTASTELKSHLATMETNKADYWIETFGNVVKYIKERNAATITETKITNDSLQLVIADNLSNTIYDQPLTIRRVLPTGWSKVKVYNDNVLIPSTMSAIGAPLVTFDIAPDKGKVYLVKDNGVVSSTTDITAEGEPTISPNPFINETIVNTNGAFKYTISTMNGKAISNGTGDNNLTIGGNLNSGTYVLKISKGNHVYTKKIIKQ